MNLPNFVERFVPWKRLNGIKMQQLLKEMNVWTVTVMMRTNNNVENFKPAETLYSTAILLGVCEFQL
jgi:hypothetical protein